MKTKTNIKELRPLQIWHVLRSKVILKKKNKVWEFSLWHNRIRGFYAAPGPSIVG